MRRAALVGANHNAARRGTCHPSRQSPMPPVTAWSRRARRFPRSSGRRIARGVFITQEGNIRWEYYAADDMPPRLRLAIQKFEAVAFVVARTFPENRHTDARRQLANCLRAALEAPSEANPVDAFRPVEDSLSAQYAGKAALRYAAGSALSALVLSAIASLVYRFGFAEGSVVAIGAMTGVFGALASVLLRVKNVGGTTAAPLWAWTVEGLARTLLGALFGGVIVVLIKANIVIGIAALNPYALYTMSLVGGFSERLCPPFSPASRNNSLTRLARRLPHRGRRGS